MCTVGGMPRCRTKCAHGSCRNTRYLTAVPVAPPAVCHGQMSCDHPAAKLPRLLLYPGGCAAAAQYTSITQVVKITRARRARIVLRVCVWTPMRAPWKQMAVPPPQTGTQADVTVHWQYTLRLDFEHLCTSRGGGPARLGPPYLPTPPGIAPRMAWHLLSCFECCGVPTPVAHPVV